MQTYLLGRIGKRLYRSLLAAVWLLIGLGCAVEVPVPKHPIMGSDFGFPNYKLTLQTETERAAFHVKLFTLKFDECASGNIDYVEFDGAVNKDAVEAFQTILLEAQGCKTRKGRTLYPFVYLNSSSGDLREGYALGDLFRKYNIETLVTQGQICKGACAMAFLGGKLRKIQNTGLVIFASNKTKGIGIDCERASEQVLVRAYLQKMLDTSVADRLYFNLLNYCAQPEGWALGADVSSVWGVTNE